MTRHYASWPNGSKASRAGIDCSSSLSITKNYKDASKFGASACTRIIKDKYLASISRARYNWKRKKSQPDPSLADYAISIRMQPDDYSIDIDVCKQKSILSTRSRPTITRPASDSHATAHHSRCRLYEKEGDIANARAQHTSLPAVPTINCIAG